MNAMRGTLYYIYFDKVSKTYEIYQTHEKALTGEYDSVGGDYYFACFSRLLDASRYVQRENNILAELKEKFGEIRNPIV